MSIEAIENSEVIPRDVKQRLIAAHRKSVRKTSVPAKQVAGGGIRTVDIRSGSDIHMDCIATSGDDFHLEGIGVNPDTGLPYGDMMYRCWYTPSASKWTPRYLLGCDVEYLYHMISGPSCRSSIPGDRDDRMTVTENAAALLANRADFRTVIPYHGIRRLLAQQYLQWLESAGRISMSGNTDTPERIASQKMRIRGRTLPRACAPYPMTGTI